MEHKIIFFNKEVVLYRDETTGDCLSGDIPGASIIKLVVILYCVERFNLQEEYKVKKVISTRYPNILRIHSRSFITIKEMVKYITFISDNDCYNFLLNKITLKEINKFSEKYGIVIKTDFSDENLSEKGLINTLTVEGTMKLLIDLSENEIVRKLMSNGYFERAFSEIITETDVYHKTGSLFGYYHDVGWFEYNETIIYAILLTSGYSKIKAESLMSKSVRKFYEKISH